MAYVTPQTYIYLYNNIPLPSNYEHTFYFDTLEKQTTYFTTTKPPVKTYAPTTYQNITAGVIRVGEKIKDIYDVNYMKFTNGSTYYENKTYYCFVTNVVYINENTTELHYTIDVMQTYLFQYSSNGNLKKPMFVDRTHISKTDDVLGANCMFNDEGLDLGIEMYTDILNTSIPDFNTVSYGVVAYVLFTGTLVRYPNLDSDTSIPNNLTPTEITTTTPHIIVVKTPAGKVYGYNNTINVTAYQNLYNLDHNLLFPLSGTYFTIYNDDGTPYLGEEDTTSSRVGDGALGLSYFVQVLNALGKSDAIVRIILLPTKVMGRKRPNTNTNVLYYDNMTPVTTTIKSGTTFGTYTPKNKKLYAYPYNYIVVDNNENDSKVYMPQNITSGDILDTGLKICYQASFLNGELVAYPVNYVGGDVSNGIIKNIGVETAYITSAYKDWLANSEISRNMAIRQHKINSMINIVGGSFGSDGSSGIETGEYQPTLTGEKGDWIASPKGKSLKGTGGFVLNSAKSTGKAMVNSYNFISNLTQQKAQMAEIPNALKGSLDANMSFITNRMGFKVMRVRVQAGVAKRIDDYFSVYGYKIMDWQIPQLKVRANWTFIKTAGCAVVGDIPKDFESAIDQIFDNGITFWANTANFMNYGDFSNPDPT